MGLVETADDSDGKLPIYNLICRHSTTTQHFSPDSLACLSLWPRALSEYSSSLAVLLLHLARRLAGQGAMTKDRTGVCGNGGGGPGGLVGRKVGQARRRR